MTAAALLALTDGRFPSGGHAHSHGLEAACALGAVTSVPTLEHYLDGRLATTGVVDAAFAAAASANADAPWHELDVELAARTLSPALRLASRSLGRQLLRAADAAWPSPLYARVRAATPSPFHPIALGAVARAAGLTPTDAALAALHHLVSAITSAAVRLLGLDPFAVAALVARTSPRLDVMATTAATQRELPSTTGLLAEVLAEHHATWEVRLFAS
jgi:urease accessory protein